MDDKPIEKMAIEVRREYYRNWGKANKDKKREYYQRYWQRKAMKMQSERKCSENGKNEI